jgi:hypothetical protein
MNVKKLSAAVALGAVLTVGAVAVSADPGHPGRGGRGDRPVIAAAVQAAADQTGLTVEELAAGLQDGSTLAEVVTAAGGDVQAVIDAAVAAGQIRIDEALAAGRITAEQAATLTQELVDGITAAVNGEIGPRWMGRGALRVAGARELVSVVADATGLTAQEVAQQWRDGSTLNDIATANGADPAAIIETAVADATERVNQAVANGRMTQTQADLGLESLSERFTEAMNAVRGASTTVTSQGVGA